MMAEVEAVTGRVVFRNRMGRLLFLALLPGDEPMTWEEVEDGGPYQGRLRQVFVKRDVVGEAAWNELVSMDLGVVVTCSGPSVLNRAGEPQIEAHTALMGDVGAPSIEVEIMGIRFTIRDRVDPFDGVRGWSVVGRAPEGHLLESYGGWWAASATVDDIVADIAANIDEVTAKVLGSGDSR